MVFCMVSKVAFNNNNNDNDNDDNDDGDSDNDDNDNNRNNNNNDNNNNNYDDDDDNNNDNDNDNNDHMSAVFWTNHSQYFTALTHILFINGNWLSSPITAMLLAYLLTFNDFLQYND